MTVLDLVNDTVSDPRLAALENTYRGRCWLIGNGPSLRQTPLDRLAGEYSFAMNGIAMLYPHTTWRPSFYFCVSANARFEQRRGLFEQSINLGIPSFLSSGYRRWGWLKDAPHIYWIHAPRAFDGSDAIIPLWSDDVSRIVGRYGTSMYCVMQIAVYLGFTELVLVGCDLGWRVPETAGQDPNHFDPNYFVHTGPPDAEQVEQINREMLASHRFTWGKMQERGIRVINAGVGGELDVYPRLTIEQVLGGR